eukprot:gene10672-11839_t
MALSLFPTNPGVGNSAPVFQLRAGKCQLSPQPNGKFRVSPDLRRGNLVLTYESDRLLHFKWINLSSQAVEDDRIVMPGDCVFKKVKTGREADRVYQLHFPRATASHLLFWLQDKASEKDEENVKRLNEQLNKQAPTSRPLAVPSSSQQNFGNLDLSAIIGQLAGNLPGSRPAPAAPASSALTIEEMRRAMGLSAAAAPLNEATNPPSQGQQEESVHQESGLEEEEERKVEAGQAIVLHSPELSEALQTLSEAPDDPSHFEAVTASLELRCDGSLVAQAVARGDLTAAFYLAVADTFPAHTPPTHEDQQQQPGASSEDHMEE